MILTGPFLFEISYDWASKAPLLILFLPQAQCELVTAVMDGGGDPHVFFRVDVLGAEGIFSGEMPRCYLCSFGLVEFAAK